MATAGTDSDKANRPAEAPTFPDIHEESETLQFRDASTPDIYIVSWTRTGPVSKPGANILLWLHGLGEHSGRYKGWAQRLLATVPSLDGIASYDQRGHGKSGGTRGLASGMGELVDDFVKRVSPRLALQFGPDARIVIGGHSMGGVVCAGAAAQPDWLAADDCGAVRACVLTSPALKVIVEGTLNRILAPVAGPLSVIPGIKRLTKANGITLENLSHDEEELKKYDMDEQVHDMVGLGLAADFLSYGTKLIKKVKAAQDGELLIKGKPVLILHGDDDHVCPIDASRELAEASSSVKLEAVAGGFHELHNEKEDTGRRIYFETLAAFLTSTYTTM